MAGFPNNGGNVSLQAPLDLPVKVGAPLTTETGNTLDDGSSNVGILGGLAVGGAPVLNNNSVRLSSQGAMVLDAPGVIGGTFLANALNGVVTVGTATTPIPLQLSGAGSLRSGTGAPAIAGTAGDLFFRTDTPTVAGQRIYICTVTGTPGTWVGIV